MVVLIGRQSTCFARNIRFTSVMMMSGGFHGERDNLGRVSCAGWAETGLPCESSAAPEKCYG